MFDFSKYVSSLCLTSPIMCRICIWFLQVCVGFVFGFSNYAILLTCITPLLNVSPIVGFVFGFSKYVSGLCLASIFMCRVCVMCWVCV